MVLLGGWVAEHTYIPTLLAKSNVDLVAIFDQDMERTQVLSKKYAIPCVCSSLEEFWGCGLDGVVISTPNDTHYFYTCEALKRGIGVLCEKPVAQKASEVEEMIRISREKKAVYVPGVVNRWRQDIQMMYQSIKNGELDKITMIDVGWLRKSGVPRPGT